MLTSSEVAQARSHLTPPQRCELVGLVFAAATAERQSQHHGTYTHLCEISGQLTLTHSPVGNVMRAF